MELESLQKRIIEIEANGTQRVEQAKRAAQNSFKIQEQKIT